MLKNEVQNGKNLVDHNKIGVREDSGMRRRIDEQYRKKATLKHYQERANKGWELLMHDVRKWLDSDPVAVIIKVGVVLLVIWFVVGILFVW